MPTGSNFNWVRYTEPDQWANQKIPSSKEAKQTTHKFEVFRFFVVLAVMIFFLCIGVMNEMNSKK